MIEDAVDYADAVGWADPAAAHTALADHLRSRDEFVDAGVSDDDIVWARFIDGGIYVHVENDPRDGSQGSAAAEDRSTLLPPEPGKAIRASASAAGGTAVIPASTTATLLEAYGPLDGGASLDIAPWLTDAGYTVDQREADIDTMLSVAGSGVFLYNGHGGDVGLPFRKGEPDLFVLTSVTPITSQSNVTYAQELEAGRMAWASVAWTGNPDYRPNDPACKTADKDKRKPKQCQPQLHKSVYAVTDRAIQDWRFADGALVVLNACTSTELEETIFGTGNVGAFAGWTSPVAIVGAPTVLELFFDRLLGRNEKPPDEFPDLRPFDAGSVFTYMEGLTKITDPVNKKAKLKVTDRFGTILVPSIKSMEVKEPTNELFIEGLFGQREGKIVIGETELDSSSWSPEVVAAKIEDTGPTSAGVVTVEVDGRKSNPVPLTEWRGTIGYSTELDIPTKGLKTRVEFDVHLRADVHMYREDPGDQPLERRIEISTVGDSTAPWSADGSGTVDGVTFTLRGSGELQVEENQPDHDGALFMIFGTLKTIDPETPPIIEDLTIHAHLAADSTAKLMIEQPGAPAFSSGFPLPLSDALNDVPLTFDKTLGIEAGQVEGSVMGMLGSVRLYWDDIPSKFPPSLEDPPQG